MYCIPALFRQLWKWFYGIPGLALSVERYSVERGDEMHPFIHELIEKIYVAGQFSGLLNVNFPLRGTCDWDI